MKTCNKCSEAGLKIVCHEAHGQRIVNTDLGNHIETIVTMNNSIDECIKNKITLMKKLVSMYTRSAEAYESIGDNFDAMNLYKDIAYINSKLKIYSGTTKESTEESTDSTDIARETGYSGA